MLSQYTPLCLSWAGRRAPNYAVRTTRILSDPSLAHRQAMSDSRKRRGSAALPTRKSLKKAVTAAVVLAAFVVPALQTGSQVLPAVQDNNIRELEKSTNPSMFVCDASPVRRKAKYWNFRAHTIMYSIIYMSVPASPDPWPWPAMSTRRGEGLSGGCKAGLALKEKDSFLLLPRPWSRCSGRDGSAQCPSGTHDPC